MASEIRVPEMGESISEATVGRWMKEEGDRVAEGDEVVELETEKVNLVVSAEEDGVLARRERAEGETVRIGDVLGVIGEAAEAAAPQAGKPAPPGGSVQAGEPTAPGGEPVRATPLARRRAESYGIDLASVSGTGVAGRIVEDDVERARASEEQAAEARLPAEPEAAPPREEAVRGAPRPAAPSARREQRVRLSTRRRTIARRLTEAHLASVMTTTFNEIDMGPVSDLRSRRREGFRERSGVDLGLMPFFVKAVVAALHAFPQLNAELDGEDLILKEYYDIGIAVDAEEGLVVPALRDADRRSFADIERAIRDMVQRARERRLTLEELEGGTFTITNGGVFGSLLSTPVLNPPQVGILGMHRIGQRALVVDGQVVPRPAMFVALTYDHRAVDGATAVRFLVRLKELIEDPELLLLEG